MLYSVELRSLPTKQGLVAHPFRGCKYRTIFRIGKNTFILAGNLHCMTHNKFAGLLLTTALLFSLACNHPASSDQSVTDPAPGIDYFKDTTAGLKTGGIKMVTINTPKGAFKVWTK